MGGGYYSLHSRTNRASVMGYDTKGVNEIFTQRTMNNAMSPYGVLLRESRDSEEHPESLAIIIALDVTGSMGSVPHHLIKEGLPHIMDNIIQSGIKHPQVLFMGIGDHSCDTAPLQIGQFESSDELLDKWLTDIYLENGGGGNDGESYHMAWYFAGHRTALDCFEKRNQKGFLFTIGDEKVLSDIDMRYLQKFLGDGQYETFSRSSLLSNAMEKYHVYHIHIKGRTTNGQRQDVMNDWKQFMGSNLIIADDHTEVSKIIPRTIQNAMGVIKEITPKETPGMDTEPDEMIL